MRDSPAWSVGIFRTSYLNGGIKWHHGVVLHSARLTTGYVYVAPPPSFKTERINI